MSMSITVNVKCDKCNDVVPIEVEIDELDSAEYITARAGWSRMINRHGHVADMCNKCKPNARVRESFSNDYIPQITRHPGF